MSQVEARRAFIFWQSLTKMNPLHSQISFRKKHFKLTTMIILMQLLSTAPVFPKAIVITT